MTYYCNHCGAVLDHENDVCPSCGCRGQVAPTPERSEQEIDTICPVCGDFIPLQASCCPTCKYAVSRSNDPPPTDPTTEPSRIKETRKQQLSSNLTMLTLVMLMILIFLLMNVVSSR